MALIAFRLISPELFLLLRRELTADTFKIIAKKAFRKFFLPLYTGVDSGHLDDIFYPLCYINTRKYPLWRYFLGVLTHTTAWDQHWEGDETLKWVSMYVAWLHLA